jgi:hypothetical protein
LFGRENDFFVKEFNALNQTAIITVPILVKSLITTGADIASGRISAILETVQKVS